MLNLYEQFNNSTTMILDGSLSYIHKTLYTLEICGSLSEHSVIKLVQFSLDVKRL